MTFKQFKQALKGVKSGDKAVFSGEWEGIKVENKLCVLEVRNKNTYFLLHQDFWRQDLSDKNDMNFLWSVFRDKDAQYISSIQLLPYVVEVNGYEETKQYLEAVEKYTNWKWISEKFPTQEIPNDAKQINICDYFAYSSSSSFNKKLYNLISLPRAIEYLKEVGTKNVEIRVGNLDEVKEEYRKQYETLSESIQPRDKNGRFCKKENTWSNPDAVKTPDLSSAETSTKPRKFKIIKDLHFKEGQRLEQKKESKYNIIEFLLDNGYIEEIKEEETPKKWEPKCGDKYFYIHFYDYSVYESSIYSDDDVVTCKNNAFHLRFPTYETTQAKSDLLKDIKRFPLIKTGDGFYFFVNNVWDDYESGFNSNSNFRQIILFEFGLILPITATEEDRENRKKLLENYSQLRSDWY